MTLITDYASTTGQIINLTTEPNVATIELCSGADTLNLSPLNSSTAYTLRASDTASASLTVAGTGANDTMVLERAYPGTASNTASIDLAGGLNSLTLAAGGNVVSVANMQTLVGGSGGDSVTYGGAASSLVVNLLGGADMLSLPTATNNVTALRTETLLAGAGNDSVNFDKFASASSIDLGNHVTGDTLTLASTGASVSIGNVETVVGSTGGDVVQAAYGLAGGVSFDLGAGDDVIGLQASATNTVTLTNIESVTAGSGADVVVLSGLLSASSIDLGSGSDAFTIANTSTTGTYYLSASNVESVVGSSGTDYVVASTMPTTVDLAGGTADVFAFGVAGSTTVTNTEIVVGTSAADALSVTTAVGASAALFNMIGGADAVSFGAQVSSLTTVRAAETVIGSASADNIVVERGSTIDMGASNDSVTLGQSVANTVTVKNVETLVGGTAADTVHLDPATIVTTGSIDLGVGADVLNLASAASNTITVNNVETLTGGGVIDAVTVNTSGGTMQIDLAGFSGDSLTITGVGNLATLLNVESIVGSSGADTLSLSLALSPTIDLGAGSDALTLATSLATASVSNVETLIGTNNPDILSVMSALASGSSYDLGAGADAVTLASASANSGTLANVETVLSGAGNDVVGVALNGGTGTVDLSSGTDVLVMGGTGNNITVSNAETITGSTGVDAVTLTAALVGGSIDLGDGVDTLSLANGANSLTIGNVESLIANANNDQISLAGAQNGTIDLLAGSDTLTLGNFTNTVTVLNVETLSGGTLGDVVSSSTALSGTIDLKNGSDALSLGNTANSGVVINVESLVAGSGNDTLTNLGTTSLISYDLGAGTDTLKLSAGGGTVSVANVETITGGAAGETIVGAFATGSADGAAGNDTLSLLGTANNTLTLQNFETVLGSGASDVLSFASAINGTLDLGDSTGDAVSLANVTNTITLMNVETLIGGTDNDAVLLAVSGAGLIDLSGGTGDSLSLGNFAFSGTIINVETLYGSSSNDTVTLTNVLTSTSYDLGAGTDTLSLATGANTATIINIELIYAGSGADLVTMGNAATFTGSVALGNGADNLSLGSFDHTITVDNVETITGGVGNDLVYLSGLSSGGAGQIDLQAGGADTVYLLQNTVTWTVANAEFVVGSSGNDTIVANSLQNGTFFNLLGGTDVLSLAAAAANVVTTNAVERVVAVGGNDSVSMAKISGGMTVTVDLAGGADALTLGNFSTSGTGTVSNVETLVGGTANELILLGAAITGSIDGGAGTDTFILHSASGTTNSLTVTNVESLVASAADDLISYGSVVSSGSLDLGGGNNSVSLSSTGSNTVTLTNIQNATAGAGNDSITFAGVVATSVAPNYGSVDLGNGADVVSFGATGGNTVVVVNVESVYAGSGADVIRYGSALTSSSTLDLGTGANVLSLADFNNSGTVTNVSTLTGGNLGDVITLTGTAAGVSIDLSGGTDKLSLSTSGSTTMTVQNIEEIYGSSAADLVSVAALGTTTTISLLGQAAGTTDGLTFGTQITNTTVFFADVIKSVATKDDTLIVANGSGSAGLSVDLGGDATNDTLQLTNSVGNSNPFVLTVSNTETVTGSLYLDTLYLGDSNDGDAFNIDLSSGFDTLRLNFSAASNTGSISVANVESIVGSTLSDKVALFGAVANTVTVQNVELLDASNGNDYIVIADGSAGTLSANNIETLIGGSQGDVIQITTAGMTGATVDLGIGSDLVSLVGAAAQTASFSNIETLVSTSGNADTLYFSNVTSLYALDNDNNTNDAYTLAGGSATIDLSSAAGSDLLSLTGASNTVTILNVETITGGTGADLVSAGTTLTGGGTVNLSSGLDLLTLGAASNISMINVETLIGSSGADSVTLSATVNSVSIDLAGNATDAVSLADGTNTISVTNVESVTGGTGADLIYVNGASGTSVVVTGGVGNDVVAFNTSGTASVTISTATVESITGGAGSGDVVSFNAAVTTVQIGSGIESVVFGSAGVDNLTNYAALTGTSIDFSAGADVLSLGNFANTVSVLNLETITGGTANDLVSWNNSAVSKIDLGLGNDMVSLVTGTASVYNIETIVSGNSGVDSLTFLTALTNATIDLSSGADLVSLSTGSNNSFLFGTSTTVSAATITGGASNDIITVGGQFQGRFDGSSGSDVLQIAATTGTVSTVVMNVETIIGGSTVDLILFSAAGGNISIDLAGSTGDKLSLNGNAITYTLSNVEAIISTAAAVDTLYVTAIDTLSTTTFDLSASNDLLTLAYNTGGTVSVSNVETLVAGSGSDVVIFGASPIAAATLYDLGGGTDIFSHAGTAVTAAAITMSVANAEIIIAAAGANNNILNVATIGTVSAYGSIDLGASSQNDVVTFSGASNFATVINVESISGGSGADVLVIGAYGAGSTFHNAALDMGAGLDSLNAAALTTAISTTTFNNVETLVGTSSADLVSINTIQSSVAHSFDLGAGADTLSIGAVSGGTTTTISISNIETVQSLIATDDYIVFGSSITGGQYDFSGGTDSVVLSGAGNSIVVSNTVGAGTLANVESVLGGSGADLITGGQALVAAGLGGTIDLSSGADALSLGAFANTLVVSNIESITGNTNTDIVTITGGLSATSSINLGANDDTLVVTNPGFALSGFTGTIDLGAGAATDTLSMVQSITGTGRLIQGATVLSANIVGSPFSTINADAGNLSLTYTGDVAVTATINTVGGGADSYTVATGTAADVIVVAISTADATGGGSFNFGAGSDSLNFSLNALNGGTVTLTGIETVTGSSGADIFSFTGDISSSRSVSLGSGNDFLTLVGSVTANNLTMGAGNDSVSISSSTSSVSLDFGAGTDTLTIAGQILSSTLANVETVLSSASTADSLTIFNGTAAGTTFQVDLSGGSDLLMFTGTTSVTLSLTNVESVTGTSGVDAMTLADATGTMQRFDGGLGGDTISFGAGYTNGSTIQAVVDGADLVTLQTAGESNDWLYLSTTSGFGQGGGATGTNAANNATVANFDAANDRIILTGTLRTEIADLQSNSTNTAATGMSQTAPGAVAVGTGTNYVVTATAAGKIDFTFGSGGEIVIFTPDIGANLDVNTLFAAIGSVTLSGTASNGSRDGLLVANDGTNTGIYYINDLDASGAIQISEIQHVMTINGTTAITASNFYFN